MKTLPLLSVITAICLFYALTVTAQGPSPAKPAARNTLDKGDFKVGFPPSEKRKKTMPADEKAAFQEIADSLNSTIALPRDVYLNIDKCDEANAFYDPDGPQIKICYELLGQYEEEFKSISKDQKKVDAMVEDTLVQTLFHELGHCLIDLWDLPATGREEDAVDQLATVLLLDGSPEGQNSAINAALEFAIASSDQDKDDMVFWDEHSFSKTRFYDMICLVYGSNPKKNSKMVGDDYLPADRAERCPAEYNRANRAWMQLLKPYILE